MFTETCSSRSSGQPETEADELTVLLSLMVRLPCPLAETVLPPSSPSQLLSAPSNGV